MFLPSIRSHRETKERIKILPTLVASLLQCQFEMATHANSGYNNTGHSGTVSRRTKQNGINFSGLSNSELGWPPAAIGPATDRPAARHRSIR